ncbi:MAG: uncharacterized protein KVP18_000572 [Porospora cf. gigantea A]|uniref:uncharacterized protein n=1 Tax=Porospora cf. gigantea A TaxID=2853593 RepID=UPI0035597ADE|nr:MAG: hypothetical protein KVP18_000572 [Porospora cf. gigantea A]
METTTPVEVEEVNDHTEQPTHPEQPKPAVPTTDEEKRQLRAEKFGIVSPQPEATKKQRRSARFGTASETDKKRHRAQRFNVVKSAVDSDRLKARKERFVSKAITKEDSLTSKAKIEARKLRFG